MRLWFKYAVLCLVADGTQIPNASKGTVSVVEVNMIIPPRFISRRRETAKSPDIKEWVDASEESVMSRLKASLVNLDVRVDVYPGSLILFLSHFHHNIPTRGFV